jgi:nucleotide-binding universal stress UspA family protein
MNTFHSNPTLHSSFAAPKNILVATDLMDGQFLIPHAIAQARATGAYVTLVHAIAPLTSYALDGGAMIHIDSVRIEEEVREALAGMACELLQEGIPCSVIAHDGFAAQVIEEAIASTRATRLIMATHGRGRLGQLILGSVANQLLGTVTIPVFAVGPHSHNDGSHLSPRRILHPVSMTGNYRATVKIALELAKAYDAELTLLHIPEADVEQSIHPGCTLSWAENLAALLIPETEELQTPIHFSVAFGNPVGEICKEAASMKADWIVVGVDENWSSWPFTETTAYKVLTAVDCPVCAIPHGLRVTERRTFEPSQQFAVLG